MTDAPALRIRPAQRRDRAAWVRLRHALWPECPVHKHQLEIKQLLDSNGVVFVAEDGADNLVGFAEVSLRSDHVDGASTCPVPYLEGWYVAPKCRRRGIGKCLMKAVESWAIARGHIELASDADLENTLSIRLHKRLGFSEIDRNVTFLKKLALVLGLLMGLEFCAFGGSTEIPGMNRPFDAYNLDFSTPVDPRMQEQLQEIDRDLRSQLAMTTNQTAVGLLDLNSLRLAMIHPDRENYAASIPKVGILLAYFHYHPSAATNLDSQTRHELGLMAKASNNEMAAKFSRELGLKKIQAVLDANHLYDTNHGGGIWVGKHYGKGDERYPDPVSGNSHAATVRQLLRYFLLLEQRKLVSPAASLTMREIFASPDIPHDNLKFVAGLEGRNVQIIRKWGTWENWHHDAAIVTGGGRHYILVALTKHPKGDEYLVALAKRVDDLIQGTN